MKLVKKLVILGLTCSVAFSAVPTAKEKFEMADVNKDGYLTQDEYYGDQHRKMEKKIAEGKSLKGVETAPSFESVDKNKDGKVFFSEFDVFHTKRMKDMAIIKQQTPSSQKGASIFNSFDTNQNGSIDKNEFKALYIKYIK